MRRATSAQGTEKDHGERMSLQENSFNGHEPATDPECPQLKGQQPLPWLVCISLPSHQVLAVQRTDDGETLAEPSERVWLEVKPAAEGNRAQEVWSLLQPPGHRSTPLWGALHRRC